MKGLTRTLAILASLFLIVQTFRHGYLLWLAPRTSVLAQYDRPMSSEIESAKSLDELVRRYDPLRKEVERLRAERRAAAGPERFNEFETEPYKSERELHEAIMMWESQSRDIAALRFYWSVGLVLSAIGFVAYTRGRRWLGVTLAISGLQQMVYWTSPEFMSLLPGGTREFDRLLANKLAFSVAALAVLGVIVFRFGVFAEGERAERADRG